jgi:hypothetical protein
MFNRPVLFAQFAQYPTSDLNIPRQHYENQVPPYWYPLKDGGRNGKGSVIFVCSNQHHSRLSNPHEIDLHGNVTPSCVCGWEGCNFHATITLLEWQAA